MKKVFVFTYEVDYGGGLMLIAANDKYEAMSIAEEEENDGCGYWAFSNERIGLSYNGETGVIESCCHAE